MTAAAFSKRSIFNAALLATAANGVSFAAGMVASIFIARDLAPQAYGEYAYVVWLCGMLILMCTGAPKLTASRFISEFIGKGDPDTSRRIHATVRLTAIALAALCTLAVVAGWAWMGPQQPTLTAGFLLAIVVLSFVGKSVFMYETSAAKGYGRFWIESAGILVFSVVNLAVVAWLWWTGSSLARYLQWFCAVSLLHGVFAWFLSRTRLSGPKATTLDAELTRRMRSHFGWSVVLTLVGAFANKSFEILLLNHSASSSAIAYFTIAATLTRSGVELMVGGLSTILVPLLSFAYGQQGDARVRSIFLRAARYYQFVGILICGGVYFAAEPVVLILYGDAYRPVIVALQVMVVAFSLPLFTAAYSALLTATDHQRLRVWFSAGSLAISAASAFVLVPRYGFEGALASVVISNWASVAIVAILVRRLLGFGLSAGPIARQFAAAAPAFGLAWLVAEGLPGAAGHILAAVLYAVVYLLTSLPMRAWERDELASAAAAASRVPVIGPPFSRLLAHWQA